MPIPWLAVLQSVPWTDVVKNAPKVADGAKKLWNAIGKQSPLPEPGSEAPAVLPEDQAIDTLRTQLAAVEAAVADLHGQMLASSELIKALAEQNTQLIQRIEANRARVVWLAGAIVVVGILALSSLVLLLVR
jgi:cytochrome c-type biogenesis protein CcmH/NrfG